MFHSLSLRTRLIFTYVLLSILTVASLGGLGMGLLKRSVEQREMEFLTNNAQAVARQVAPLLVSSFTNVADRRNLRQLAETSAFLGNIQVRILDTQGRVLVDSGPRPDADQIMLLPSPELNLPSGVQEGMVIVMNGADRRQIDQLVAQGRMVMIERTQGQFGNRIVFNQPPQAIRRPDSGLPPNAFSAQASSVAADRQVGVTLPPSKQNKVSVPIVDNGRTLGSVEASVPSGLENETYITARSAFLFAALGAIALAIFCGIWVSKGLTLPMVRLAHASQQMSLGNLAARAQVLPPLSKNRVVRDEISLLAEQFNQMAEKLEASFKELGAERDALRRFIADASHELRTPITALKTFNELMQSSATNDKAAQAEFLGESQKQVQRLEWITSNLLNLSRLDAGLVKLDLAQHRVKEIVEAAVAPFRPRAEQQHVSLHIDICPDTLEIVCDRARMELVVSNLFDNALKFLPVRESGNYIEIKATQDHNNVQLCITDSGCGISPDDLPHVFERFYRGSHGNNAPGTGIGLAIVRSIMQAHGGAVSAKSTLQQGSEFCVTINQPHN
jgi:signal transduction histidine kinase